MSHTSKYGTRWFTGFTYRECQAIAKVVNACARRQKDFEFPEYGGLAVDLANKLSPDQVDVLQDLIDYGTTQFEHVLRGLARGLE